MRTKLGSSKKNDAFGADETLPLVILIVVRANPPMLDSVLTFAERFIPSEERMRAMGYAMTQARLACSFAESVRPESLVLKPGEWKQKMPQDVASRS